jgi:rhomboid protease GluP
VLEDGEWWRLVTASFLHFGPIHLATNMFVLWILGRLLEPVLGTARMLTIYAIGGVASSAFVLALMVANDTDYGLLVGASGAIFALLGAEAGLLLADWLRNRATFDSRKLSSLAMMLGLQVVIDMSLPNVSFAAHASGFVTGLVVMLAWPYAAALINAAKSAAGRHQ